MEKPKIVTAESGNKPALEGTSAPRAVTATGALTAAVENELATAGCGVDLLLEAAEVDTAVLRGCHSATDPDAGLGILGRTSVHPCLM
ncbi:MAG: hypothetical protein M3186_10025 [Actinomycetota bacterium]|nr:hypothetical protein [Actinomycetota bacterium]